MEKEHLSDNSLVKKYQQYLGEFVYGGMDGSVTKKLLISDNTIELSLKPREIQMYRLQYK